MPPDLTLPDAFLWEYLIEGGFANWKQHENISSLVNVHAMIENIVFISILYVNYVQ